jgi:hypothetical protein
MALFRALRGHALSTRAKGSGSANPIFYLAVSAAKVFIQENPYNESQKAYEGLLHAVSRAETLSGYNSMPFSGAPAPGQQSRTTLSGSASFLSATAADERARLMP